MTVRRLLKQETVLTIIMITVTTILIIGATVAWFLGNRPVTIRNYFQQAGGIDGIDVKMAIVPEDNTQETDTNIEVVDEITYYTMNAIDSKSKEIDVDLAELINIEEGKLAPGSYGTIKFKISTTSETAMNYVVRITPDIKVVESVAEEDEKELLDLVQNHIKFYAIKNEELAESNPTNVYQEVIPYYFENSSDETLNDGSSETLNSGTDGTSDSGDDETESSSSDVSKTGLTGTVSGEKIEYVTIYWYWAYEYTDIPGYNVESYNSTIYNPWQTQTSDSGSVTSYEGKYSSQSSEAARIEAYDWDDTKIGNYVTSINFHFEVSSYQ